MKKYLIIAASLIVLLTGCSANSDKDNENNQKENTATTNVIFKNLIKETKNIREKNNFNDYQKITYPGSPYDEYMKFYVQDQKEIVDKTIKTTIELYDYKLVKESGELAFAYVGEHTITKGNTLNFDVEMEYYYVFKKEKGDWKIYDFVPTNVFGNEEALIKTYKTK